MPTWEFTQMGQNPFDAKDTPATDPKALYMYGMRRVGSEWFTGSGMEYSDVVLLLKHFKVESPSDLVGKTFDSVRESDSSALNLLLVQIRLGGNYTPPTPENLLKRAAEALSRMVEPDFRDVDNETVYMTFQSVWDGFRANEDWLTAFKTEVSVLSEGNVQLVDANSEDFPARVKGPANYLELVSGERRQKVVMGPYSTPISFEN